MTSSTIWLTYDPHEGFERFDGEAEGRTALDSLRDYYIEDARDGVDDEVEHVALYRCERVAHLQQTITARAEDDSEDGERCRDSGWGCLVDLDVADDPPPPHERERDEARAAAIFDAIEELNDVGDDDMQSDEWLAGFEAAITALGQIAGSPDRGEE